MRTKTLSITLCASLMLFPLISLNAAGPNYTPNRAPLVDTPFVQLPVGSVKANGWLLTQLQLQRDGLTGHAEEIYPELTPSGSAWLGNGPENFEKGPYYVRGLVDLAYTLNDASLITKARNWIEKLLASQQSNGYIGPTSSDDWWPRMPMLAAVRDYYEATGDSRVITFLRNYFTYQNNNTKTDLGIWGGTRVIDNIDAVIWLYNRTGDAFLVTLMDKLKALSFDWSAGFTNYNLPDFASHGVNVAEGYKFPAIWYQRSNSGSDKNAYSIGNQKILAANGQPTGMSAGTEFLAGKSSLQGYEQCAVVERIWSDSLSIKILGDPAIGDTLEKIAFNAMPATLSKTLRQQAYYTVPNQAQSSFGNKGYGQDYANGIMPSWLSGYPCCCFNWTMGWPKFTIGTWAATNDNGLGVMAYAPTTVTAKVGNGTSVTFVESTNYPFEEQIRLTLTTSSSVSFPLKLRIPAWCATPSITVNGNAQNGVATGTFYTINRTWNNNDVVLINFPMTIKAVPQINNSTSIERGPLVYSLKIGENWRLRTAKTVAGLDFSEYEVLPTTAWNYALVLDRNNPAANMSVNIASMPANPFVQGTTPITITAKARKLPSWGMAFNGLPVEVPNSPANTTSVEETVTLVPFGAENLRVTYFPVYGHGGASTTATFLIVNRNSGMALDLIGGNEANGALINQWTYDYNSPNQKWLLVPTENGDHFKLISAVSGKSACIDVDSMDDGAQLHYWTYTGNNPAQQWDFIDIGNGWFKLRNVKSGKLLEIGGGSTANNGKAQQWTDNGGAWQQWRLQPWGDYYIDAQHSGRYIAVANQGSGNGYQIVQYDYESNPWFRWRFENVVDGWYKVSSLNALSRVVDISGVSTAQGAPAQLWDYLSGDNQKVRFVPMLDGSFKLYFRHTGMAWNIQGASTLNYAVLQQWADLDVGNQKFYLERNQ